MEHNVAWHVVLCDLGREADLGAPIQEGKSTVGEGSRPTHELVAETSIAGATVAEVEIGGAHFAGTINMHPTNECTIWEEHQRGEQLLGEP